MTDLDVLRIILVVEDDPDDQVFTRRALESFRPPLSYRFVSDGQSALDYLTGATPRPAMLLLDLNLPRLGGLRVLEAVRNNPSLHGLPIVVFTTSSGSDDRCRSLSLGAKAFVTKPENIDEYMEVVRSAIASGLQQDLLAPAPGTGDIS